MTSSPTAGAAHLDTSTAPPLLRITGDWTLAHYANLKKLSDKLDGQYDAGARIDLNGLGALDTAGASLLVELLGPTRIEQSAEQTDCSLSAADRALLKTVYRSLNDFCVPEKAPEGLPVSRCWHASGGRWIPSGRTASNYWVLSA